MKAKTIAKHVGLERSTVNAALYRLLRQERVRRNVINGQTAPVWSLESEPPLKSQSAQETHTIHLSVRAEPTRCDVADLLRSIRHQMSQDLTDTQRRDSELLLSYVESAAGAIDALTLEDLGMMYQITRERARQILEKSLEKFGWSSNSLRDHLESLRSQEYENRREAVVAYVSEKPGLTLKELERLFDVSVLRSLESRIAPMILPEYPLRLDGELDSEPRRRIIESLQQASLLAYPLTGAMYDRLIETGLVQGLSRPRVLQVFGSWARACHAADVVPGRTIRSAYDRRFTKNELLMILGEFVVDQFNSCESASKRRYEQYRRAASDPSMFPSSQTIRDHVHKSWPRAIQMAVEKLRHAWDT
jgi:hypothetical protein